MTFKALSVLETRRLRARGRGSPGEVGGVCMYPLCLAGPPLRVQKSSEGPSVFFLSSALGVAAGNARKPAPRAQPLMVFLMEILLCCRRWWFFSVAASLVLWRQGNAAGTGGLWLLGEAVRAYWFQWLLKSYHQ